MKKIKRAYYYFYYKIYKSIIYTSEKVGGEFLTDFKAVVALGALEIWFLSSILIYYSILNDIKLTISITDPVVFIPLILVFILNYFAFINTDVWKEYNKEFDQLPEEKNREGTIIVWVIAIFIMANFFGSAYYLQKYILKMY